MKTLRCIGLSFVLFLAAVFILITFVMILAPHMPAFSREGGDWDKQQETFIIEWFRTLKMPDLPLTSCCGEADAYEADIFEREGDQYVAIITAHRGPTDVPIGTRIPVPNHKMKYDAGNPTGHGIIFLGSGQQVYCYVTPGGI